MPFPIFCSGSFAVQYWGQRSWDHLRSRTDHIFGFMYFRDFSSQSQVLSFSECLNAVLVAKEGRIKVKKYKWRLTASYANWETVTKPGSSFICRPSDKGAFTFSHHRYVEKSGLVSTKLNRNVTSRIHMTTKRSEEESKSPTNQNPWMKTSFPFIWFTYFEHWI